MPHLSFGTLLAVHSSSQSISQFRPNFKGTSVIKPLGAGKRVSALLTPGFQFGRPATKTQALVLFEVLVVPLLPNSISIFFSDLRIDLGFDFVSFPAIDRAQFIPFPFLVRDSRVRVRVLDTPFFSSPICLYFTSGYPLFDISSFPSLY